jgi:molybdate transport system substrate-binding protein
MIRAGAILLAMLAMMRPAAAETVQLYAAGSLKGALTDIAKAYDASTGNKVEAKYGPSGLLKKEIAGGAKADVFASANMEHPQALHDEKKSGPVIRFARNKLCALVRPGLAVDSAGLLKHMLDPSVKLGTSTPKADPSGDYACEVFRKADAITPGAQAVLEKKALQLTGGAASATPPSGRAVYGWHVSEGRADIFLTYCTNALAAQKEDPRQQIVALPDNLTVGADYGLTVMLGASSSAQQFAEFIMSSQGQQILAGHGFGAGRRYNQEDVA